MVTIRSAKTKLNKFKNIDNAAIIRVMLSDFTSNVRFLDMSHYFMLYIRIRLLQCNGLRFEVLFYARQSDGKDFLDRKVE